MLGTSSCLAASYTISLNSGVFYLIADHLDFPGGNQLSNVIPAPPENTSVYKWNTVPGTYEVNNWSVDYPGWTNPNMTLNPGEAVLIWLDPAQGAGSTITFTGTARPPNPIIFSPVTPGYHFLSTQIAGTPNTWIGTFENIMGIPPSTCPLLACSQIEVYRVVLPTTAPPGQFVLGISPGLPVMPFFFQSGQWKPFPPQVNTGEGVIVRIPSTPCSGIVPSCPTLPIAVTPVSGCKSSTVLFKAYGIGLPSPAYIKLTKSPGSPCGSGVPVIGPVLATDVAQGYLLSASIPIPPPPGGPAPVGPYDVVVTDNSGNTCGCLPGGFKVNPTCAPPDVHVRLVGPTTIAVGQPSYYALYYDNQGGPCPTATFKITSSLPPSSVNTLGNASCAFPCVATTTIPVPTGSGFLAMTIALTFPSTGTITLTGQKNTGACGGVVSDALTVCVQ